jgi:hypothetical protein
MFWKKDVCYRGGNMHNFQPRYTNISEVPSKNKNILLKPSTKKYVRDVCVWCGKAIEIHR